MPRRMAGTVEDPEQLLAHGYGIALLQPAIRQEGIGMGKSRHPAPLGQFVQPELVLPVGPLNWHAQLLAQYV